MKALSVRQPWASLIATGAKTIELRSWRTAYRGPLVIVAARTAGAHTRPRQRGVAVALVDLVGVRAALPEDARAACVVDTIGRRYAWELADVRPLLPVAIRGWPGLFAVNPSLVKLAA